MFEIFITALSVTIKENKQRVERGCSRMKVDKDKIARINRDRDRDRDGKTQTKRDGDSDR